VSIYEDYGEKHISPATLSEKELTPSVTNLVSKSTLTEHGAEPSRAQIGKMMLSKSF
jgi:nuclear pore complex protein Nup214